jgi:TRAP transporter TAXI family solute receptor
MLLWFCLGMLALDWASAAGSVMAASEKSQTVIIGTLGTGTINYAAAVALADLLNKHAPLKASPLPQTGVPALLSLLKDGAVHVITISAPDAEMADRGTRLFQGRRQALRLLHPVYSVEQALLAAGDTTIHTTANVRGKRVPGRYTGDPGTELGILGQLANRGLSYNDVLVVPVTSYPEGMRAVIERKADVVATGLTSPLVQQLRAARGFRIIPADSSPEAIKRTQAAAPGFTVVVLKKDEDPSLAWLKGDANIPDQITLLQYWFYLAVSPGLSDEVAYEINRAVWEHYKELGPVQIKFPRDWNPDHMVSPAVIPYHPGAVRWFREKRAWTPEMEQLQKRLLGDAVKE